MKIKLVENWKDFYKWYSVQAKIVVATILIIWDKLPVDLKSSLPDGSAKYIAVGILVIGGFGTLVDQYKDKTDGNDASTS